MTPPPLPLLLLLVGRRHVDDSPRTRDRMLDLLGAQPGLSRRELQRKLGLTWATVCYHVETLRGVDAIHERIHFGRHRYYLGPPPIPSEVALMPLLRDELPPRILELIAAHPGIGIQAISNELDVSRKIIRRFIAELAEAGVVQRSDDYRPKLFLRDPLPREREGLRRGRLERDEGVPGKGVP